MIVGGTTVKVVVPFPPRVVRVTVLADLVAVVEMAKVAVTVESFTTAMLLTVTPVPETVRPEVVSRYVPDRVTL